MLSNKQQIIKQVLPLQYSHEIMVEAVGWDFCLDKIVTMRADVLKIIS